MCITEDKLLARSTYILDSSVKEILTSLIKAVSALQERVEALEDYAVYGHEDKEE